MRVPLTNSSLTDAVFEVERETTAEEVNQLLTEASDTSLKNILRVRQSDHLFTCGMSQSLHHSFSRISPRSASLKSQIISGASANVEQHVVTPVNDSGSIFPARTDEADLCPTGPYLSFHMMCTVVSHAAAWHLGDLWYR